MTRRLHWRPSAGGQPRRPSLIHPQAGQDGRDADPNCAPGRAPCRRRRWSAQSRSETASRAASGGRSPRTRSTGSYGLLPRDHGRLTAGNPRAAAGRAASRRGTTSVAGPSAATHQQGLPLQRHGGVPSEVDEVRSDAEQHGIEAPPPGTRPGRDRSLAEASGGDDRPGLTAGAMALMSERPPRSGAWTATWSPAPEPGPPAMRADRCMAGLEQLPIRVHAPPRRGEGRPAQGRGRRAGRHRGPRMPAAAARLVASTPS